jgi:hypothetical protein
MKPQPPTKDHWRQVYEAAATRRALQELEYQKGDDGLGGCLCILVVTVLAILVYTALFFAWI